MCVLSTLIKQKLFWLIFFNKHKEQNAVLNFIIHLTFMALVSVVVVTFAENRLPHAN